ncbi:protease inhibitor I42 family protein [Desulfomonile tiedjei]|uniref:Putative secreted protein n=1 Tax=Desulfomonile tiedjei (strain ATCC 49306 / DSM 6799 / DCB-1) TaxID=706587 RepID=I4CDI4_DESTA|nr:protease inhibitor I42 family protein [Desulfomonile tiedjei]AFM27625.1 putative secreted protein [Desulfomonile tiedjei DSM 6799]
MGFLTSMRKGLIFLIWILFTVPIAFAEDTQVPRDTVEEKIEARLNETFKIVLDSNPSTGYTWQPVFDKKMLKLEKSAYTRPEQQIPGRGGKQTYVFRPVKAGRTMIELQYARRWEKNPAKTRKYLVTIQAPLQKH